MVDALWVAVQDSLRSGLSSKDFDTWIRPLRPQHWDGACLTLEVPSAFVRDWLTQHLAADLETAVAAATKQRCAVRFVVNPACAPRPTRRAAAPAPGPAPATLPPGLQRYSFDNFVIGGSNAVAFNACRSVVEAPGIRFNPLVIHGGVGLGKTHLLCATAATILARGRTQVRFVPAEHFVNELVLALRQEATERFRARYRGVGVLIVDDVQFLAGKRKSQEEFLHTFNALRDLGRQIILASDRSPDELTEMSSPLRSRLTSGLLAGIAPPDAGMRIELVRRKLVERGVEAEPGVDEVLAGRAWENVRALEGLILRVEAEAGVGAGPIDRETAERAVGGGRRRPARAITPSMVVGSVCSEFGVSASEIDSRLRTADVALARQVAMHLCRVLTDLPLKAIGRSLGGRDHSTVAHAVERMDRRLAADADLRARVRHLEKRIVDWGGVGRIGAMDGTDGVRGTRQGAAGAGSSSISKPRASSSGAKASR